MSQTTDITGTAGERLEVTVTVDSTFGGSNTQTIELRVEDNGTVVHTDSQSVTLADSNDSQQITLSWATKNSDVGIYDLFIESEDNTVQKVLELTSRTIPSGDTVIVGSKDTTLYAVDTETANKVWEFGASKPVANGPTVVDGTAYVGSDETGEGSGKFYAINSATGTKQWSFDVDGDIRTEATVVDGTVYFGMGRNDPTVFALDAETGNKKWKFNPFSDDVLSAPTIDNGTVYVGGDKYVNDSATGKLYAIDSATGTQEWVFNEPANRVTSSPTVVGSTVYFSSQQKVYALDAGTGNKEWEHTPSSSPVSSPTVVDGTLYTGFSTDGPLVRAIETINGTVEWSYGSGKADSSPTVVNNTLYITSDTSLHAVNIPTQFEEWRLDLSQPIYTTPTVAGGIVYIGIEGTFDADPDFSDGALVAVDAETGTETWRFNEPTNHVYSPTVVANGNSIGSRVELETLGHREPFRRGIFTSPDGEFAVKLDTLNIVEGA